VSGVKALLAHIHGDAHWAHVKPPLALFPAADRRAVTTGYDEVRAPAAVASRVGARTAWVG
jgi:4-hydroxy-tetrahydrodipicolinate synthase